MNDENEIKPYVHIERFGTDEVDGINVGTCHVFPKIDGTNASVWYHSQFGMGCGSRTRFLNKEGATDNAGFREWAMRQESLRALTNDRRDLRIFGEWLVPHSLKTYRDDAWQRFYVFDMVGPDGFLHFDEYSVLCKLYGIDFIPCTALLVNPTYEVLRGCVDRNTFLIQDNQGIGEGVVIKQYGYRNRFGRCTWAKIVTNSFKDKNAETFGPRSATVCKLVEEEIASEFIDKHAVDKIVAKIRLEHGQFGSKNIPQLLGMAYHDLVTENMWEAAKKHRNPKVDFKTLNFCAINRVKELLPELFGKAA